VAVSIRSQAEAIAAPALKALVVLVALVAIAGCGGGGDDGSTPTERDAPASAQDTPAQEREPSGFERAPRSRRDVEAERDLERHLKQEAAVASGWTYTDVEAVHVRGTRTVIETDIPPSRREAGASLCLAARSFSSTSDLTVTGTGRSIIGRC
jgi:predicted small lipoprotein YifL